jgi:hypothetical protein
MAELISAICSAGFVILCESEYSCLTLFKRKTTLFFFICQLAIFSSALQTLFICIIYFIYKLKILLMLVIITVTKFFVDSSYPIMMLLRLKLVIYFPIVIIYISLTLAAIFAGLRYFWILSILTNDKYYFNIYYIIQPILSILLAIENIIINIFFVIIAIKKFDEIIHIKNIIIINVIAIILEIIKTIFEFVLPNYNILIASSVISIIYQIKIRLQIIVLSNIASSSRSLTQIN